MGWQVIDSTGSILNLAGPTGPRGPAGLEGPEGPEGPPGPGTRVADPTANVGLTVVNGSASAAMRADAAPPLDQAIAPTWTAAHIWKKTADSATGQQFQTATGAAVLDVDAVNVRIGIGTASPAKDLDILATANQETSVQIKNLNTGAATTTNINLVTDAGRTRFLMGSVAAGKLGILGSDGGGGLFIQADHATGSFVDISSSGNSVRIGLNGELLVGTTGVIGKSRLGLRGGSALATTDWALTSGWGANATISAVAGVDSRGTVTVTTSALDTPGANPVITLTFKDGSWLQVAPFAVTGMEDSGNGPLAATASHTTATTLVITYIGTPTAVLAKTYVFNYIVVG